MFCVGLDIDSDGLTASELLDKTFKVIEETSDYADAYKLNMAFFMSRGINFTSSLNSVLDWLQICMKDKFLICDLKCGDTENTNKQYARAVFDKWKFDAVTVNPFCGMPALQPFFDYKDKTTFVWTYPTTPSNFMINNMVSKYRHVWAPDVIFENVRDANTNDNVGLILRYHIINHEI